jgi:hypothetical protein
LAAGRLAEQPWGSVKPSSRVVRHEQAFFPACE